jgi:hypothetical protein
LPLLEEHVPHRMVTCFRYSKAAPNWSCTIGSNMDRIDKNKIVKNGCELRSFS